MVRQKNLATPEQRVQEQCLRMTRVAGKAPCLVQGGRIAIIQPEQATDLHDAL